MIKFRETLKMLGALILTFGAVTVCTIFLNLFLDLKDSGHLITEPQQVVYQAQLSMSKVIVACAGGCLGAVAFLVLFFSAGRYINDNKANMGVLKAMGYPSYKIALPFIKFGFLVFIGAVLGYAFGMLLTGPVYRSITGVDLPEVKPTFQIIVPVVLVVLPTILALAAIYLFSLKKLQKPPLDMIRERKKTKVNKRTVKKQNKKPESDFLKALRSTMLSNHPLLLFFIAFAAFGFSTQFQLSFTMIMMEMSDMAAAICFPIGLMMGVVTLVIAADFILNTNRPYITIMKAYGYSDRECSRVLLDCYRPFAWLGFVIGTVYQYFLVKFMVSLFAGAYEIEAKFNLTGFFITVLLFLAGYEVIIYYYKKKIVSLPLRENMQEI